MSEDTLGASAFCAESFGSAAEPSPGELVFSASDTATSAPDVSGLIADELPFLRRSVRRWGRTRADAEDLVQDTVVRALASAHSWQPGTDLRAWLFTIMRNQFYATFARSANLLKTLATEEPAEEPSQPDGQDARLTLRDVQGAMKRLPAKQRLAILLVAVEGKSYEHAALSMDTTVSSVRCHLARGRQRLREVVDQAVEQSPFARSSGR